MATPGEQGAGTTRASDRGASAQRALAWGLVWLGLLILVLLAWQLRHILVLAFLGLLAAAGIYTPVHLMERRGLPRIVSVVGAYLALVALLVGLGWLVIPPLIGQVSQLVQNLPQLASGLEQWVRQTVAPALPGDVASRAMDAMRERIGGLVPSLDALVAIPIVLFEMIANLVLVVFLSALLLLERDRLVRAGLAYLRPDRRDRVQEVGRKAMHKLGAYVRGQLLIMVVIGVGTGIGMFILGVPFVLPMSVLAFLTEAIPLVGPYLAGIPIVALAFLESPLTALLMAAWMFGLQQLEGYVLAPMVQRHAVQLSPVVVMLAVVAGGALAGILGALIAIPIVAVVQVVMSDVVLPMRKQSWG